MIDPHHDGQGAFTSMKHPTSLPLAQREHLARVVRQHGLKRIAIELGLSRPTVANLAAGLPTLSGSVALAQAGLPRLDAVLSAPAPSAA